MLWIVFALMTVVSWGLYGPLLNKGAIGFEHNRIKAFLFVGVAYFLVAVLLPALILAVKGEGFVFKPDGIKWSLIAGSMGAIGALTLLFALSNNPLTQQKQPAMAAAQVMSVVFAGAPIVAAVFGIVNNPPKNGLSWGFIAGLVLAAAGGALVTLFKP